jgi:dTDP-4-amino-4,6-dideoxygalactose transaminase
MTLPKLPLVPFHQSLLGRSEARAAEAALKSGTIVGSGPFCLKAEARLRNKLGSDHVFLVPSGTAALELAMMALELKPGDEVILPSWNFVSGANAVVRCGARPVFADVRPETLNLDPGDVEKRITRRTKAILLVHYGGTACDMAAFLALGRRHGLALVEDAALSLGASWRGRPLGTLGDLGCFSFHASKLLTCGEGGALACRRRDLADKIEILREKGTDRSAFIRGDVDKYTWRAPGSSFVLSDILAAVLCAQLGRWRAIFGTVKKAWDAYAKALRPLQDAGILRLAKVPGDCESTGSICWFILEGPWKGRRREALARLRRSGVPAAFHYVPLHDSPFGKTLAANPKVEPLKVTQQAGEDLIRLPLFPGIRPGQCAGIAAIVGRCLD